MRKSSTIKALCWWMRAVGGFYLLLPVIMLPPFFEPWLPVLYPGLRAPSVDLETRALAEVWWLLALGLGVIGGLLLRGASRPRVNFPLVRLVLAWELIVGVGGGLFLLVHGDMAASVALMSLVPPLLILGTGWWVLPSKTD